jgi:transcription elongation GreA/GreB family factor
MSSKDKHTLLQELLSTLERTLHALELAHADATEAATHEEAKPENDKDTRAIEASYLARGQAARVEALHRGVVAVKALVAQTGAAGLSVVSGSLVEVEEDDTTLRFLLAPEGGGTKLSGGVQVVTPGSPLGQALLGRQAGDGCEVSLGGRRRDFTITQVW